MNITNIRTFKNISPTIGNNTYIDSSAVVIGEVSIADNVSIWPLVAIRGDVNSISIGKRSNVQDGSILHVTHKNKSNPDGYPLYIGEVSIADDVSIWPLVAIRGDVNSISIGKRSNVQDGSILHVTHKNKSNPDGYPLNIGEDVTIGHKCMLHGCTLGNRILVGMGAIIMDNVVVEDDVFIGAGTLVPPNKTLKSGYLYMGNPMKQARKLKEAEFNFLKQSASNYVRFKDEYIAEQTI